MLTITAKVNGRFGIIINEILRVPYSSNVELYCKGPGRLSWQYRSNMLNNLMKTVRRNLASTVNKKNHSIVTVVKFGRTKMGFYTCLSEHLNSREERTILITSGKFISSIIHGMLMK